MKFNIHHSTILIAAATMLLFGGCAPKQQEKSPKNVILIVGDGMGVAQVYASVVAEKADNSAFLRFPFTGF